MNTGFYRRMAWNNIQKNRQTYLPFFISCIFSVMMSYVMTALSTSSSLANMAGGGSMGLMLSLGNFVLSAFFVIFLFYTNSFLIKRRKKEFGILNILGMDKPHLAKIMVWETIYIAVVSIALGIPLGMLLNKVSVMLIGRMMNSAVPYGFEFSATAVKSTCLLFVAIFLLILLHNIFQTRLANPIELLRGGNVGEKEPKAKWFLALLGVFVTFAAYILACTIQSPIQSLPLVVLSIFFVIVGTYLLFTAGSIAVFKALKRNRNYYYQTRHFIPVSGMLYRMKKNAVGLSNICVMSVGIILLLSIALSLLNTKNSAVNDSYRNDARASVILTGDPIAASEQAEAALTQAAEEAGAETGIPLKNTAIYASLAMNALPAENGFTITKDVYYQQTASIAPVALYLIDQASYNALYGTSVQVAPGSVYLYSTGKVYTGATLTLLDEQFLVEPMPDMQEFVFGSSVYKMVGDVYYIIVDNLTTLQALEQRQKVIMGDLAGPLQLTAAIDFDATIPDEQAVAFGAVIKEKLTAAGMDVMATDTKARASINCRALRSTVLFFGANLSMIFLLATALIIYYKQISEAYDDKENYAIMHKVGLSRAETKKAIQSQTLTVFFSPLLLAGVHILFVFPLMKKLMTLVMWGDVNHYMGFIAMAYAMFILVYSAVYLITVRAYYKIVD